MTTHTHKGNCQHCGRVHAVKNSTGLMAKHGYTVDWGFFNGTCGGSDRMPLQQDRSETDFFAASCVARAEKLEEATIESITEVQVTVRSRVNGRTTSETKMMDREEYAAHAAADRSRSLWTFEGAQKTEMLKFKRQAKMLREHSKELLEMADKVHGTDLIANEETVQRIREEFASIRDAYSKAEELKAEGWKPRVTTCRYTRTATLTATKAAA